MTSLYTCTLTSDFTGRPKLGVRNHDTGALEGAFYTEEARRLYMAAPDLLEALEDIAEACEANADSAMGEGWAKAHQKFGAFARAAIAKATGRSV